MKVLITGANGFLGKILQLHMREQCGVEVVCFTREHSENKLSSFVTGCDFIFHLAGVNRPLDPADFISGNVELTNSLCAAVREEFATTGRRVPIVYSSSVQATVHSPYGQSKQAAEELLFALKDEYNIPVHIFRLPNLFGMWCRPNYNSVVATFCHNIAHGLPIHINDPTAVLKLAYVEDVACRFVQLLNGASVDIDENGFERVTPQYTSTVGEIASLIQAFKDSRETLIGERVGVGLVRALYATYVSYLPSEQFAYTVPIYRDARGVFAEMLKTPDSGQFSYFTAHPGITRGGHYHHTKTEKFLVIKGLARFKFRHMQTGDSHELEVSGDQSQIVETIPGWVHDITNIGSEELIVMLWANEIFDRERPDTYAHSL